MKVLERCAAAACLLVLTPMLCPAQTCQPLAADAQKRLVLYVQKKYKLPDELRIRVVEQGFIGESCYRNIRIVSQASAQFFDLITILAPDQVFLISGVADSRVDPVLAQASENIALNATLTSGSPASTGNVDAQTVIVVFSDFECPYCKGAAQVFKEVVGSGNRDLRLVFRNYPLSFHPWALRAAVSARCAADQSPSAFWKIHDFLFEKQGELNVDNVWNKTRRFLSETRTFNLTRYDNCLMDEATQRAIDTDLAMGNASGVERSPGLSPHPGN